MDVNELLAGKYLGKADLTRGPILVTIGGGEQVELKQRDGRMENKYLMHFREKMKSWIVNKTNLRLLAAFYGSNTDGWIGKQIEIYINPAVNNPQGGEPGGLSCRLPTQVAGESFGGGAPVQYPTLGAAVAACDRMGIPKEELYASFKAQGMKSYIPAQHSVVVEAFLASRQAPAPTEAIPGLDDDPPPVDDDVPPTDDEIPF